MDMETTVKEPVTRTPGSSQAAGSPQKVSAIPAATQKPEALASTAGELHHFLADIEDLFREATSLTGEELSLVKANISARLAAARASAEQLGGDIASQARKGATATNDYVHHQPWAAIGAGAAAGVLVGFLLARRSR